MFYISPPADVKRGAAQGSVLYPKILYLFMDHILWARGEITHGFSQTA